MERRGNKRQNDLNVAAISCAGDGTKLQMNGLNIGTASTATWPEDRLTFSCSRCETRVRRVKRSKYNGTT